MKAWLPRPPRKVADGYVVHAGARLPDLHGAEAGTTSIGPGASTGRIRTAGAVELQMRATCAAIDAGHAVTVGAGATVEGPITCQGRVVVQHGALVQGRIEAGGDVLLLGACQVGDVQAGGDILVAGEPKTGKLEPKGRVQARDW